MEINREYNDRLTALYTLVEEYKYLMTSTTCPAMRNFFKGKFLENSANIEKMLERG